MSAAIIAYVEGNLEHLDNDACALSVIGDAVEKFIREHDEAILACAMLSAVRVMVSGVGDLRQDIKRMKGDPAFNPAILRSDA